eukprot:3397943-Rhodomonas_salina.1
MACHQTWDWARHNTGRIFAPAPRTGCVPPWKLFSLQVSQTCGLCHVTSPAPVQWGFGLRCC